ncbi:hypothetical protein BDQ17DRAFT_1433405 [Cyathus striatus]|nr:hypothetical protein BDQ17DRAFT_1433405 [Cyathus striatus]
MAISSIFHTSVFPFNQRPRLSLSSALALDLSSALLPAFKVNAPKIYPRSPPSLSPLLLPTGHRSHSLISHLVWKGMYTRPLSDRRQLQPIPPTLRFFPHLHRVLPSMLVVSALLSALLEYISALLASKPRKDLSRNLDSQRIPPLTSPPPPLSHLRSPLPTPGPSILFTQALRRETRHPTHPDPAIKSSTFFGNVVRSGEKVSMWPLAFGAFSLASWDRIDMEVYDLIV